MNNYQKIILDNFGQDLILVLKTVPSLVWGPPTKRRPIQSQEFVKILPRIFPRTSYGYFLSSRNKIFIIVDSAEVAFTFLTCSIGL